MQDSEYSKIQRLWPQGQEPGQIARREKRIEFADGIHPELDESVVTIQRYSSFGTNLFPGKIADLQLMAGVTSAHGRSGKTTVAANLAAFFATDAREETVLVDVSFRRPRLHQIFGIPAAPGVLESVRTDSIILSPTSIKNLWAIPMGFSDFGPMTFEKVGELRESLHALKKRFRFIVLDLPAALQSDFPGMISSLLDGYIMVVVENRTRVTDVRKAMHVLNEKKVLGFVMNKMTDPD